MVILSISALCDLLVFWQHSGKTPTQYPPKHDSSEVELFGEYQCNGEERAMKNLLMESGILAKNENYGRWEANAVAGARYSSEY